MSRHAARLVLATRNSHKVAELSRLLGGARAAVSALDAFAPFPETVEDRDTLEGNAEKKAVEAARACGTWALADDSGLFVAGLGGAPGVHSARWAGPGRSYADNCAKLVRELDGAAGPMRAAYFRTVMALSDPDGRVELVDGRLDGTIAESARGGGGFGYDPLFLLPDGRTLAELEPDEKNAISHRGRALRAILPRLLTIVQTFVVSVSLWFAVAVLPLSARAEKTEPGQETVWDQIMAAQAVRGMRQGHRYIEEKKYDLALQEMRRAVAADPKNPVGHMLLGVAQYWNGQVDESIASYGTAIVLDPASAQAYLLLGISHAWKGDAPASERAFRRATELDPARADAQMNLGSIRETRGDVPEALSLFRKAVDLDKKNPLYRFQLGQLYRKLGRDADAAEQLREAIKLESAYEDAMLELGCAEERLKEDKAAIGTLKRAVALKPGDSVARMRLARLYLKSGERAKARAALADAFRLTPESGGGGLQLSVSYAGGKRPAKPGEAAPDPKAPEPEPDQGDPLAVFERNLRRVPLDQGAMMKVDAVFLPRPKLVRAGPGEGGSLKKALSRAHDDGAPDSGAPSSVRREYALKPGDAVPREAQVKKIMDDLRKTMREAPPDSEARLGMNLAFTRPVEAGRGDAENPAKVSYQPRQVGNDLGLWVIGTGWMALVAEVLPEPGEKPDHPDDADWWTATGLAHAAVGEGQRADSAFRRASELDGASVPAWLGRGVSSVMIGDETGAVAALRRALEIAPKNKAAADGLKWLLRPAASAPPGGRK